MFNIGIIELLIIFFFLVLFIKPEEIPKITKNFGLFYRKISRYLLNFKYELDEYDSIEELKIKLDFDRQNKKQLKPSKKNLKNEILRSFERTKKQTIVFFFISLFMFFFFLYNVEYIGNFLTKPLFNLLSDSSNQRMIFTALPEVFVSNLKISLFASFLVSIPFLLIQVILFASPALYKKEKKIFIPLVILSPFFFFAGLLFAYYFLIPVIWNFFYFI